VTKINLCTNVLVCLIYFRPKIGNVAITPNLSIMKNRYDLHVTSTKDNRQVVYTSLITCDLYKGQQTSCIHKLDYMWPLQRYRMVVSYTCT